MFNSDMIFKDLIEKYSLKSQTHKRKTALAIADTITTKSYYIKSGVLKCCYYNKEVKKEVIFCLLSAGDAILPCDTTPYDVPAPFDIYVIADAVIYTISEDEVKILQEKEPKFEELRRLNLRQLFDRIVKTIKLNVYTDMLTRYEKLLEIYPFLHQVSNQELAAILGVHRTTATSVKTAANKKPKNKK